MPKLSIVITCLEDPDLPNTLESIKETSGGRCEVIVVLDGPNALQAPIPNSVQVCINSHRCGVGPSRTIGVHHSTGDYVMLIDSHMRFKPGWYEEVMRRVEGRERTIHCAVCAGLDSKNMDVNNPKGRYYGARLELYGPDPNRAGSFRVLEGVWNKTAPEDDAPISCLMGACYVMPRPWFIHLDALRFLRSWGCDEQMLSIKSWLAGGDVRLMRDVEVGHVFLQGDEKPSYKTPVGHVAYNKLFLRYTLLPDIAFSEDELVVVYGGGELSTALKLASADAHLFETEKARNKSIFKHSFQWYAERFGIAYHTR